MSVMEACFAESGDPDEVAFLRAECARLRVRDGELRTACARLERRVNRLVEEQDWATRRIARLTDRCTHLAGLVPVTDGEATSSDAAAGGLVAALAGDGGARLAAAIQTAVGDLAALSVPDPDTGVELGCLADLPDRTVADLAAAGCRLATWAKLAATVATEELVTRWENGNADEHASPVNAQPVFPDHDLGFRAAIAETATTCVISESTLTARVDTLRELPARLPGLWHLLAAGAVDIDTARLVHSKTRHLPGEVLSRLESQILVKVTTLTWGQLAAWLDRIVAKADPRELAEQIADNLERRNVSFRTAGPGTGRMTLTASVEAIEAIRMALLGYASAGDDPDHHRPAAAVRADIITDLITRPGTHTAAAPAPAPAAAPAAGTGTGTGTDPASDVGTNTGTASAAAPGTDACTETGTCTGTGDDPAPTPPPQPLRQPQAPTLGPSPAPALTMEPAQPLALPLPLVLVLVLADRRSNRTPTRAPTPSPMPITRTRAAPVPTSIPPPTQTTRPPPTGAARRPRRWGPRPSRRYPAPGSTSPCPCRPSSAAKASERSTTTDPSPPRRSGTYWPDCSGWGHRDLAVPDHRRRPHLTDPRHGAGHRQGTPRPGPHRHRTAPRTRPGPGTVLHLPRLPTPRRDLRSRPPHPPLRRRTDVRVQPASPLQAPPPPARTRVHANPDQPGYRYADHPVGHPHRTNHPNRNRTPTLLKRRCVGWMHFSSGRDSASVVPLPAP
ncbi:MAG: DUF222 domain-containing protein [Kineosporiaceae bacterium]